MAQGLLLLFAGVWVIGVPMEPVLEEVRDRLRELATLPWSAVDQGREGRWRLGLRGALGGATRDGDGRRGHVGLTRGEGEILV